MWGNIDQERKNPPRLCIRISRAAQTEKLDILENFAYYFHSESMNIEFGLGCSLK